MAANPERGVGNDPEPLGVAFLQGPPFALMISLTLSNSSCLPLTCYYALHCLGGDRLTPKVVDHYILPAPQSGHTTSIMVCFCPFTHLRKQTSPPNFRECSLFMAGGEGV